MKVSNLVKNGMLQEFSVGPLNASVYIESVTISQEGVSCFQNQVNQRNKVQPPTATIKTRRCFRWLPSHPQKGKKDGIWEMSDLPQTFTAPIGDIVQQQCQLTYQEVSALQNEVGRLIGTM